MGRRLHCPHGESGGVWKTGLGRVACAACRREAEERRRTEARAKLPTEVRQQLLDLTASKVDPDARLRKF